MPSEDLHTPDPMRYIPDPRFAERSKSHDGQPCSHVSAVKWVIGVLVGALLIAGGGLYASVTRNALAAASLREQARVAEDRYERYRIDLSDLKKMLSVMDAKIERLQRDLDKRNFEHQ